MGLYIKDILLPEDPNEIIEFAVKGNGAVFVIGEHYWPAAVEVPEPHGRLIDADALMGRICHDTLLSSTFEKIVRRYIENAPTVIPASKEG